MEKKASTLKNMIVSLIGVTILSGGCVGGLYLMTRAQIAQAEKEKQEAAIKAVLPVFERLESKQMNAPDGSGALTAYTAYVQNTPVGIAVQTFTKKGFSGEIRLMAGFLPDGTLYRVQVLQHAETPGLGSKMTEAKFAGQFENRHPRTFRLRVRKDGGDVDAITAATISSRAYCDALERAFNSLSENHLLSEGGQDE
ncbi:MAG: RnfABCDGE type electron transport complex subunit G [Bacteroidales bacterium]|nr:RnfABCDGE type electron transport complex subunit G [Bacteroidales bacterium]